jgi:hypothetical protein
MSSKRESRKTSEEDQTLDPAATSKSTEDHKTTASKSRGRKSKGGKSSKSNTSKHKAAKLVRKPTPVSKSKQSMTRPNDLIP